uniref:Interleukin 17B n=1 Tax=Pelodiscus sinensis TaxID=13735 RepID=K7G553_PELSI
QSIQEMVSQLWNNSEPADSMCQVNLRLWRSNKRSLSPWAYRDCRAKRPRHSSTPSPCRRTGINPFTMQEDRSIVSIPIYSKLPVRRLLCHTPQGSGAKPRRKKKRCHKEYKMVMETIAV